MAKTKQFTWCIARLVAGVVVHERATGRLSSQLAMKAARAEVEALRGRKAKDSVVQLSVLTDYVFRPRWSVVAAWRQSERGKAVRL